MKTRLLATALLLTLCALITACTLPPQRVTQAIQWGNSALTIAQVFGGVKKSEVDLVRKHGALILGSFTTNATEAKVAAISEAVVDFAESRHALTPEQVTALRELGTVPLVTPPPITLPALTVTASK